MDGPALFGRDWLQAIVLDWRQLNRVHNIRNRALQDVLDQYSDLFKDGMGTLQGTTVKIHIQQDARPRFFHARPVPYALREKVTAEVERLCKADVIEPVQFSEWAAPIVPVLKNDSSIRICGDYKQTINQVVIPDKYPLPKVDDLLASLAGGETFTKLDLAHAYQQLVLDYSVTSMGPIATESVPARRRPPPFLIAAGTLFRTANVIARSRRIAIWTWRSTVPYDGRRIREANRLCLKVPDRDRTPLFAMDKESLAIIFAVTRFRQYLLGRHFTLLSDHKPLSYMLSPDKHISPMASAHLQNGHYYSAHMTTRFSTGQARDMRMPTLSAVYRCLRQRLRPHRQVTLYYYSNA